MPGTGRIGYTGGELRECLGNDRERLGDDPEHAEIVRR
jgi:hypothetical protein